MRLINKYLIMSKPAAFDDNASVLENPEGF